MSALRGLIIKESKHILRDRKTLVILFVIPVALVLIIGYVVSMDVKDTVIGVYDKARDSESVRLTNRIVSSGYFKLGKIITHDDQIESAFRTGSIRMAVVIGDHFGKRMLQPAGGAAVQIIADASEANTAQLLVSYCEAVIRSFALEESVVARPPVEVEVKMFFNPFLNSIYMSIPGIMALVLIIVTAMMTSLSITREKELGSMEILLASPLAPFQIIIGKVAPYLALASINAVTIVLLGYFVFRVPMLGSWQLLFLINFLYIYLSLALGILVSSLASTQMVAMFASMFGLLLPTMLLSGFIFPIENMPDWLQALSRILPPRYYVEAIKAVMIQGSGLAVVWHHLLVMSAFGMIYTIAAVKKFKIRME
ncbi:MAG: ABC transporter permease [Bacteroidales bacterium]|jgi:ABC-2 type transport system permease protein|nr:ABC transporter permease [Bacteroidales bacterium]